MANLLEDSPFDPIAFQVRRMRHLPYYPTGDDEELIRVARKYANPPGLLSDCISDLIEESDRCPTPASIAAALHARRPYVEPSKEWKKGAAKADGRAWNEFMSENHRIMEHAREHEKKEAEMRDRIKRHLKVKDFMKVEWGQRWQAQRELDGKLNAQQTLEADQWLESLRNA